MIPSPIHRNLVINMAVNLILILLCAAAIVIVVFIFVMSYKNTSANLLVSGARPYIASMISYLIMRFTFPFDNIDVSLNVTFMGSRNPAWKSGRHVSSNRTLLMDCINKTSWVFQSIHSKVHYGSSEYSVSADPDLDPITTERLPVDQNEKILLRDCDCYLFNTEQCTEDRIFGQSYPLAGLSTLISKMRLYIAQLGELPNWDDVDGESDYIMYLISIQRYDLKDGIKRLTQSIVDTACNEVDKSTSILVGVVIGSCVLTMISFLVDAVIIHHGVMKIVRTTDALTNLLHVDDITLDMEFTEAMHTRNSTFDRGRKKIFEYAKQVLDGIAEKQSASDIEVNIGLLLENATKIFQAEENIMRERNYKKLSEHAKDHILLRQRITVLSDLLKVSDEATTSVCKRILMHLFDKHYLDIDMQTVTTLHLEDAAGTLAAEEGNAEGGQA